MTKAAPSYANVTGLISTFALAAVVLVFLIAATASKNPTPSQNVDMGLATILFALGFLGCLIGAFVFGSLGGAPNSPGVITNSMLIASVVALCLIAVLGGFEALARAFLSTASSPFAFICAAAAALSPLFVWFPLFDIEREFDDATTPKEPGVDRDEGRMYHGWATRVIDQKWARSRLPAAMSTDERSVVALLLDMSVLGVSAGVAGLVIHFIHGFGQAHQWQYYVLGLWGLAYTGLMVVGALLFASDPEKRLTGNQARMLNAIQVGFMFFMIAVLP